MQALRLRAKIAALPELDRMTNPYTPKTLSIEEEQQSLRTIRQKIESHWDMTQAVVHGIWSKFKLTNAFAF